MQERILETLRVPTLPSMVVRLEELLADPDAGVPEVAEAVAQDPPIAATVLRIANSGYYGQREPVRDIGRAAIVLGLRRLADVVLCAAVIREFEELKGSPDFDLTELWKHSIATAQLAQALGRKSREHIELQPAELYACGLLHDIGKVVLLDNFGERYLEAAREAREKNQPIWKSELEAFEFSHPQVGGVVAFLWGLPAEIGEAIELHHGSDEQIAASTTVAVTALADRIARELPVAAPVEQLAGLAAARALGLDAGALEPIVEQAAESYSTIVI